MRLVGTTQYRRLLDAVDYYEKCGFKYVDVPWAVGAEAIGITRPPWASVKGGAHLVAGGDDLFPVASAEQSFIQLQLDALHGSLDKRIAGSFCTLTPCFRNEPTLDDLHQPYFMKVELISWDRTTREDMDKMVAGARLLFERDLWVDCVHNADPDPIGVVAYDLVTTHTGVELGSYGIRETEYLGRWLYGTGLAEPRFSYALELEEPFNRRVEAFF
jgi:hypothetical protein